MTARSTTCACCKAPLQGDYNQLDEDTQFYCNGCAKAYWRAGSVIRQTWIQGVPFYPDHDPASRASLKQVVQIWRSFSFPLP
jgi:hypothetical protein